MTEELKLAKRKIITIDEFIPVDIGDPEDPQPEDPVIIIPDPVSGNSNRKPNGDLFVPWDYSKNGLDVRFDLSIGRIRDSFDIYTRIDVNSSPSELRYVFHFKRKSGKTENRLLHETETGAGLNKFKVGHSYWFSLKQLFADWKIRFDWQVFSEEAGFYAFSGNDATPLFRIFPLDGGHWIRTGSSWVDNS